MGFKVKLLCQKLALEMMRGAISSLDGKILRPGDSYVSLLWSAMAVMTGKSSSFE